MRRTRICGVVRRLFRKTYLARSGKNLPLPLISHPHLGHVIFLSPSGGPIKTGCAFLFSHLRATRLAQLIFLDFITLTMFGEDCKL
jgi:hypothetical protein